MTIIDNNLRKEFSQKGHCEWCRLATKTECHHVYTKGTGQLDIRENLIALCGVFGDDCHGKAQRYEITRLKILEVVANREGTTPTAIEALVYRLRRTPNRPIAGGTR